MPLRPSRRMNARLAPSERLVSVRPPEARRARADQRRLGCRRDLLFLYSATRAYDNRSTVRGPPSMDAEGHERIRQIFLAACECEPAERDAFVASACSDNDVLRAEV